MEIIENFESIFSELEYDFKNRPERREIWENCAKQVIGLMDHGNIGLVGETGSGKTMVAFLVILAMQKKVIFFAPERLLAQRHHRLLNKLSGEKIRCETITGAHRIRDWSNQVKVTFATPKAFVNDLQNGIARLEDYALIIKDEFHFTVGDHAYNRIAELARQKKIRVLDLSASPGDTREKIEEIKNNCQIVNWVFLQVDVPNKSINKIEIPLSPALEEIDEKFSDLLNGILKDLNDLNLDFRLENDYLSMQAIDELKRHIEQFKGCSEYYQAQSYISEYCLLKIAQKRALTVSYYAFLEFVNGFYQKRSKAAVRLLEKRKFQQIMDLAKKNIIDHPKVKMLTQVCLSHKNAGLNAIVFDNLIVNIKYLSQMIRACGLRSEPVYSAKSSRKKMARNQSVIEQMSKGELDYIFSTSMLQHGHDMRSVNAVFHYTIPERGIDELQRSGRTGREFPGMRVYFTLDHKLDNIPFHKSLNSVRFMQNWVRENADNVPLAQQLVLPRRKTVRKKVCLHTLPLFGQDPLKK